LISCSCPGGQSCQNNVCVGGGQDGGAADGGAADGGAADGGADGGTTTGPMGGIGAACTDSSQCLGQGGVLGGPGAFCLYGFCTRACGGSSTTGVTDCNSSTVARTDGPWGGRFACTSAGNGLISICWPNGSGATCGGADGGTCPRTGEICVNGRCVFSNKASPSTQRTALRCTRNGDCHTGESCVALFNLDQTDIRSDGACLWNGDGTGARKAGGEACATAEECGSFICSSQTGGVCLPLCVSDTDCPTGQKCIVQGNSLFAEFDDEFIGICIPWAGTRTSCTRNADCTTANEFCAVYQDLANNDLQATLKGACRSLPNPTGAALGAPCTAAAQCASGACALNPVTGLGYCTNVCLGGDADCGASGLSCRSSLFNPLDPTRNDDDLRAGLCTKVAPGELCSVHEVCRRCTTAADCNSPTGVSQGLDCVGPAGAAFCQDVFAACLSPCRQGCATNADCPSGTQCVAAFQGSPVNICEDQAGDCVRADFQATLVYDHEACGDRQFVDGGTVAQQDLCYYYGRRNIGQGPTDVFLCGKQCGGNPDCMAIPSVVDGGIPTQCLTVYEFGFRLTDGGVIGGAPFSPTQCAPPDRFLGAAPAGDGGAADGG
jgi:hypothetical protein